MFKPLEGVKVIDLTYFVAGPGAAKILADWGADVIKVEPSFGDPGRGTGGTMNDPTEKDCNPFYTAYNANKRGLSLNLKAQEGKDILDKLLETADVFITSYRTGALVRLGLDYDTLSKKHPHIIWAQINQSIRQSVLAMQQQAAHYPAVSVQHCIRSRKRARDARLWFHCSHRLSGITVP